VKVGGGSGGGVTSQNGGNNPLLRYALPSPKALGEEKHKLRSVVASAIGWEMAEMAALAALTLAL